MNKIRVTEKHWEQMSAHVQSHAPLEACGLIGGTIKEGIIEVNLVIPVSNELNSPVRYRMNPVEQWQAFQGIEEMGLDIVGIFHSHPDGPGEPSSIDVEEAYYPHNAYLIWTKMNNKWACRCFDIASGWVSEMPIIVAK